ncbi:CBS domain-containing protein [Moritella viscosa]
MNAALNDMVDFIKIIPPFNLLSDQDCHLIAKRVSIGYYRNQSKLETLCDDQVMLYLVKKGVVAYYNEINELQAKFSEGDLCSVLCQENIEELQITLRIEEDSLIYSIDFKVLQELLIDYPNALQFLLQTAPQRLQNKMGAVSESALIASSLTNAPIMDYYNSPAITISSQASIQNVAKYMTEKNVSCLVIMADGYPAGIVTDKDIRRRCVATGLSSQDPVTEIMTEKMATIDINLCGHDALAANSSFASDKSWGVSWDVNGYGFNESRRPSCSKFKFCDP